MDQIRLGRTELYVSKTAFGALPIQRISHADAVKLVRRAYESGINYFDTANAYTDSEEKLGAALHDVRHEVILSTKSGGGDKKTVQTHIEESLRRLQTDYIDLFQFHNPAQLPDPEDPDGPFAAVLEAKQKGYIRHIGITAHRLQVALDAVDSGLYETIQFPFSYLSSDKELELVRRSREKNMGFLAMKALAGGLINQSRPAMAFMAQFDNVLPIWGIQREGELEEWLAFMEQVPELDGEMQDFIAREQRELAGEFCRGCGYCMPCPVGIQINQCARMSLMLRRAPSQNWLTGEMQAEMKKIEQCLHCNQCSSKCPYELDTPALLAKNYEDYQRVLSGEVQV